MAIKTGFKAVRYASIKEFILLLREKYAGDVHFDSIELQGLVGEARDENHNGINQKVILLKDSDSEDWSVNCYIPEVQASGVESFLHAGEKIRIKGISSKEATIDNFSIDIEEVESLKGEILNTSLQVAETYELMPLPEKQLAVQAMSAQQTEHEPSPFLFEKSTPEPLKSQSTMFPFQKIRTYIMYAIIVLGSLLLVASF